MDNYTNAIEINGLTKKYDGFTLNNISFNVPKGSIMGFGGESYRLAIEHFVGR